MKVIAKGVLVYRKREYPFEWPFEDDYPVDAAEYFFKEGNFSCDCNRSIVMGLNRDLPCGKKVELKSFEVITKI